MKPSRWILWLIPLAMLAAGPQEGARRNTTPKGRLTLPKDAQRIDAYTHSYTDKDGKSWIYRQTPFGLVRYRDESKAGVGAAKKSGPPAGTRSTAAPAAADRATASAPSAPKPAPSGLRAFDEGESVRFERDGPFGKYTWVRKKGELTAQEEAAWEAAKQKQSEASKAKQE